MNNKFVKLRRWMGFDIAVNIEAVVQITPDTEETTNLYLSNGQSHVVEGTFEQIYSILNEFNYNNSNTLMNRETTREKFLENSDVHRN